jgi:RNA polymerase sigma-70 factor (ECF subfamily)
MERLYPRVRRFLLRMVGPRNDLEDLVQSTMETLLRKLPDFQGKSSVETFADGIALNVARNRLRHKGLKRLLSSLVVEEDLPPMDRDGPQEEYDTRERFRRLWAILDTMSSKRRIAYVLVCIEGRSTREASELTGANPATVRTRVYEARREVERKAMEDPYLSEWLGGRSER